MSPSLSKAQVEQYGREGFLAPLPGLTPQEAGEIRSQVESFGRRHGVKEALILRNKAHLKMPSLMPIIKDPRVLDVVESVLGPDLLCWGSSLFIKEPGGPEYVAWHQDSYYWDMEPEDVCVVWIALIESTRENGAMGVFPGTHLTPFKPHKASEQGSGNMLFTYEEADVEVDEKDATFCLLQPGEMSLHHMGVLHGSGPNVSNDRRMGYSITYVASHVKHSGKRDSAILVRGEDNYGYYRDDPISAEEMDPEVCAFIDAPYGGNLPAQLRSERPDQSFYRKAAG